MKNKASWYVKAGHKLLEKLWDIPNSALERGHISCKFFFNFPKNLYDTLEKKKIFKFSKLVKSFSGIFQNFCVHIHSKVCIYSHNTIFPSSVPAGNYMFKVNNGNTRTRCEICSKLTTTTPGVCLVTLLLTLNIFQILIWCFYC